MQPQERSIQPKTLPVPKENPEKLQQAERTAFVETLKAKFENEEQIRNFFTKLAFEKYCYVNYDEFRQIFGDRLEEEALGRVKKYWSEVNVTYYNLSYDLLWPIKWAPVAIKYATGIVRFRLMSMILLFGYLEAVDLFLEPIALHYYKRRRMIKLTEAFDYHLVKDKYQEMRFGWLGKYLQVLENNIENGVAIRPDKDKKLLKKMNQHTSEDNMFLSIDQNKNTQKKDDIPFKKQIDEINKLGVPEYIKKNLNQINEQAIKEKITSTFTSFKDLYFDYKRSFQDFPKRSDFEQSLHPKYLPGSRVMTWTEEFQHKIKNVARMIDYASGSTKIEDTLERHGFFPEEVVEKKEKRRFRLGSNVADFLIFSAVFIAPMRMVKMAKHWKYIKYKFSNQSKM